MLLVKLGRGFAPYDEEAERECGHYRAGEVVEVNPVKMHDPIQHRKFFKLWDVAYQLWCEQSERKRLRGAEVQRMTKVGFRKSVTIRAGYFNQWFDFDGNMHIDAQSLRYDAMTDDVFRKCYSDVVNVLMQEVLDETDERAIRAVLELAPYSLPETTS